MSCACCTCDRNVSVAYTTAISKPSIQSSMQLPSLVAGNQVYTAEETLILRRGMDFFEAVKSNPTLKDKDCSDPHVSIRSASLQGDSIISGIIEVIVDGDFREVAAYEYLKMSRSSVTKHIEKGGIDKFTKRINDHSQYYIQSRDLNLPGFGPREWRQRVVWSQESQDDIVVVYEDSKDDIPDDHNSLKRGRNVLASAHTVWKFTKLNDTVSGIPQTRTTMVTRIDIAIPVPKVSVREMRSDKLRSVCFL